MKTKKPLSYGRQWVGAEEGRAVLRVLKSDFLTQGPEIEKFESEFAAKVGARYAVAVSHGTAALHIACQAAGLKKEDEVITTPMTFTATASCVVAAGAKPIFADIDPETWNLDSEFAARKITRKTRAIIPVDYAGLPADMAAFRKLAKANGLILIRDAAHSVGASESGKMVGSGIADMTTYSFHPVKNMTTAEGGMVVTQNKSLYKRLLMYRNHGIVRNPLPKKPWWYEVRVYGNNYRMSELHAALGRVQLKKLSKFVKKRRQLAAQYNRELGGRSDLRLQAEPAGLKSSFHLYVVEIRSKGKRSGRLEVFRSLQKRNIEPQVHYIPLHMQPLYRAGHKGKRLIFPNAEDHYRRALSLPLFPSMSLKDVSRVTNVLREALESRI